MDTANDPSYTPTPTKKSRVVVDTEPRPVEMPTSAEAPPLFMECEDEPLSAAQKTHRQEHAKTLKEAMDKLEVLAAKNPTIQMGADGNSAVIRTVSESNSNPEVERREREAKAAAEAARNPRPGMVTNAKDIFTIHSQCRRVMKLPRGSIISTKQASSRWVQLRPIFRVYSRVY